MTTNQGLSTQGLSAQNINVFYDKMHILHDVSLEVGRQQSEFVALLGRNGVGKSTTIRAISGLTPPRSGSIHLGENDLASLPPDQIARLGIGTVLQGQNIFPYLSVAENLRFNLTVDDAYDTRLAEVFGYFPNLKDRLRQNAGTLSGGERQMLAIGRAWLGQPQLILLDEPTTGLMPKLVWQVAETLREIHEQSGVNILLVEQEVELALKFSDRVYIMEKGEIVFQGKTSEITLADVLPYLEVA
ncbi:MAG: ABC transporter ATP-binding protein [Chloroflexota bacterium]